MQAASCKFLAVFALAVSAAVGLVAAEADTYDGVVTFKPAASCHEGARGAADAARDGNLSGNAASAGLSPVPVASRPRADVHRQAVAYSRAGNPYGEVATEGFTSPSAAATARRSSTDARSRALLIAS